MSEKTQRDAIREIWQGMYGVEGSEEKGMVGDVKEVRIRLQSMDNAVSANTTWRRLVTGIGGGCFLAIFGILAKLLMA